MKQHDNVKTQACIWCSYKQLSRLTNAYQKLDARFQLPATAISVAELKCRKTESPAGLSGNDRAVFGEGAIGLWHVQRWTLNVERVTYPRCVTHCCGIAVKHVSRPKVIRGRSQVVIRRRFCALRSRCWTELDGEYCLGAPAPAPRLSIPIRLTIRTGNCWPPYWCWPRPCRTGSNHRFCWKTRLVVECPETRSPDGHDSSVWRKFESTDFPDRTVASKKFDVRALEFTKGSFSTESTTRSGQWRLSDACKRALSRRFFGPSQRSGWSSGRAGCCANGRCSEQTPLACAPRARHGTLKMLKVPNVPPLLR